MEIFLLYQNRIYDLHYITEGVLPSKKVLKEYKYPIKITPCHMTRAGLRSCAFETTRP